MSTPPMHTEQSLATTPDVVPRRHLAVPGDVLGCHTRVGTAGIWWVEAMDPQQGR